MAKAKETRKNIPKPPAKKIKPQEVVAHNESSRVEDEEDDGISEIQEVEFMILSNALRYEVNKNRRKLKSIGLCYFIHQKFDDMEDVQG